MAYEFTAYPILVYKGRFILLEMCIFFAESRKARGNKVILQKYDTSDGYEVQ